MRFTTTVPAAVTVIASGLFAIQVSNAAFGDDQSLRQEFDEKLKRALAEQDQRHAAEMDSLKRQMTTVSAPTSALQDRIDDLVGDLAAMKGTVTRAERKSAFRLIDVSLNTLVTAGTSSGTESEIQALSQGGHDPKKRGFTLPNVELMFSGAVDPYFNAQANVVTLLSPEGETEVELEEAFAATSSLPYGLQAKAGQFYTQFGRHNPQHPHQWDFVNAPVVNTRILGGDGLRGPGAQISWLGTEVPLELTYSIQNANGETATSFLGTADDAPPAGTFVPREVRSFHDVVHTTRAAISMDATDEIPILFGVSSAFGPSGASAGGDSRIVGADVTLKWKPLDNQAGFPFVAIRGEYLRRNYEFDTPTGADELHDSGWYGQAIWGFTRDWTLGVRYDKFSGDFGGNTPGLDDRTRTSAALTYYTSEFAKLRLQVDHDDAKSLRGGVTSIWIQLEFNLGQHGGHKF